MFCAKSGWPGGSGDEDFVNIFSLFRYYLALEKYKALHLDILEFPLPMDTLCKVWLKLALLFWKRGWECEKFTVRHTDGQSRGPWAISLTWENSSNHKQIWLTEEKKEEKNPLFTLGELTGSSFEQTWIPFIQGCIVPSLFEISRAVLEPGSFRFC